MASTETKLVSRIVLSAAVFISLSASIMAEEARRCFWCGPLAEQVHRSQRAPPCTSETSHVTVCDQGFPHCAIVATSPPHIESRYCVKFYQDECYSLYCNSTRTWRMTCPCRGDLCNGPNTGREDEAFAVLAKLVAKTNNARIKRASISSRFINLNRKIEISNNTVYEKLHNEANDTEINASNAIDIKVMTQNLVTEMNVSSDESIENLTNVNEMQSDQPVENVENTDNLNKVTSMLIDTSKSTIVTKTVDENLNDVQLTTKEIMTPQAENKDTTTMPTKVTEPDQVENKLAEKVKPSEQLPTAEALQHNDTPANKNTTKFTVETTMISTTSYLTTEPNMRANNTATQIKIPFISLAIGIILQY